MFAVPGWKIATQVPVQELVKPVRPKSRQDAPSQDEPSANPKKRKRDQGSLEQGLATTHSPNKPQASPNSYATAEDPNKKHNFRDSQVLAESSKSNHHATHRKPTKVKNEQGKRTFGPEAIDQISQGRVQDGHSKKVKSKKQDKQEIVVARMDSTSSRARTNRSHNEAQEPAIAPFLPTLLPTTANLTPLQAKMRAKLTSARFRYINETLYTTSSSDALQLFKESPDLFADYHAGFSQQVKDSWPQNPVDIYISDINQRGSLVGHSKTLLPLPRRKNGFCDIADLGCGDAPLARALQPVKTKLRLNFHNFDLHTPNEHVTKADVSALPLHDGEADIAIFCLSLMGTNWLSFVEEAWRVLRSDGKGEVWVSEVKSRFGRLSAKQGYRKVVANSIGKRQKPEAKGNKSRPAEEDSEDPPTMVEDEREISKPGADDDTDLEAFINAFLRRGLALREGSIDRSNKMFVSMIFTKVGLPKAGKWKGWTWNGNAHEQISHGRSGRSAFNQRFRRGPNATNEDDEIDEKDEGKLLKPCVYKLR